MESLQTAGFEVAAIHPQIQQNARDSNLKDFLSGGKRFLVSTDICARGLHFDKVTVIINFELPDSPEMYLHRISRVSNPQIKSAVINICDQTEMSLIPELEKEYNIEIKELPTEISDLLE